MWGAAGESPGEGAGDVAALGGVPVGVAALGGVPGVLQPPSGAPTTSQPDCIFELLNAAFRVCAREGVHCVLPCTDPKWAFGLSLLINGFDETSD